MAMQVIHPRLVTDAGGNLAKHCQILGLEVVPSIGATVRRVSAA